MHDLKQTLHSNPLLVPDKLGLYAGPHKRQIDADDDALYVDSYANTLV